MKRIKSPTWRMEITGERYLIHDNRKDARTLSKAINRILNHIKEQDSMLNSLAEQLEDLQEKKGGKK